MTNNHSEFKGEQLSRQYQSESTENVPTSLDENILAMAQEQIDETNASQTNNKEVVQKPWTQWYATAAILVIGIGLVTFMQKEVPEKIQFKPESSDISLEQSLQEELMEADEMADSISTSNDIAPQAVKSDIDGLTHEMERQQTMAKARAQKSMEKESKQKIIQHELATKKAEQIRQPPIQAQRPAMSAAAAFDNMDKEKLQLKNAVAIEYTEIKTINPEQSRTRKFFITNKSQQTSTFGIDITSNQNWSDLSKIPKTASLAPDQMFTIQFETSVSKNVATGSREKIILKISDQKSMRIIAEIKTEMVVK